MHANREEKFPVYSYFLPSLLFRTREIPTSHVSVPVGDGHSETSFPTRGFIKFLRTLIPWIPAMLRPILESMNDPTCCIKRLPGPYNPLVRFAIESLQIHAQYDFRFNVWIVADFVADRALKIIADHANDPPMVEIAMHLGTRFKDERRILTVLGATWNREAKVWLIPPDQAAYAEEVKGRRDAILAELRAKQLKNRRIDRAFAAREARAAIRANETPEEGEARRKAHTEMEKNSKGHAQRRAERLEATRLKREAHLVAVLAREDEREATRKPRLSDLRSATALRREINTPIRQEIKDLQRRSRSEEHT